MLGKIYIITNDLNNKVYIGQTIQSLQRRFVCHCSKDNNHRGQNMHIKRAILKYGKEHFKISLLEECPVEELDSREIYWIERYNSYKNGYNLTIGGNSNRETMTCSLENTIDIEAFKNFIISNYPTAKEVEAKFNICHSSVYNLIRRLKDSRLKLNPCNPRKSNAYINAEEVCNDYLNGYNIKELTKIYHSTKRSISKILKENGIDIVKNKKPKLEYNISKSVQVQTNTDED